MGARVDLVSSLFLRPIHLPYFHSKPIKDCADSAGLSILPLSTRVSPTATSIRSPVPPLQDSQSGTHIAIMSTAAAREAWNEAMKATAGATALPPALQKLGQKRRSDRHKKQSRRVKARKTVALSADQEDYRRAVWIDALEGVDPTAQVAEEDDEYDELDDLDEGKPKKRKRSTKVKAGVLPKRFLPRSLASILVEEANKEDGASRAFLAAEARVPVSQQLPARKFCPVTGTEGIYTEPKSGIPYANMKALEQIRERPPPWMTLGGAAAYWEAVKSIRDE